MQNSEKRQAYTLIDILKILLALLIVISHYVNEHADGKLPKIIDLSISIYIIAVPMYFAFSGFFLFKKIYSSEEVSHPAMIKGYVLKIMRLYGVWSVIYIIFKISAWLRFPPEQGEVAEYIHKALVYSTYNTIWFLPASAVGALIAYLIRKRFGDKTMFAAAVVFCILGALGDCYYNAVENVPVIGNIFSAYKTAFISSRNGVFNAFPYIAVGAFAAFKTKGQNIKQDKFFNKYLFMSAAFGIAFIAEAFFSKKLVHSVNSNTVIMLLPFTVTMTFWSITAVQPDISKKLSTNLRKTSTAVFLSQRLFLSALPALLPETFFAAFLDEKSALFGLAWVIICTLLFSVSVVLLSDKFKWLKNLYQ